MIRTKKLAEELGGDLVIVQPSEFVRKMLLALGLDELFKIFECAADALSYLRDSTDDASIDPKSLRVDTEELSGGGAILSQPLDETSEDGIRYVGRILDIYEEGPVFRWRIPAPGDGAAGAGITTENVDRMLRVGTRLRVKLRQPLAVKSSFFDAECRVTRIEKEIEEDGGVVATIALEYVSMGPGESPFELHQGAPLRPPSPADPAHARPGESSS